MNLLFYVPLCLLVYTWFGYPLLLWIRSVLFGVSSPLPEIQACNLPSITVVVTVHNEERLIRRRLDNLASLDYSGDLRFLIVSDGSTDETDRIVEDFRKVDSRVRLFRAPHIGKSAAQNQALLQVTSEFVFLSDADCLFSAGYLRATLQCFAWPRVGCVTGNLLLVTEEGTVATSLGLYWKFERLLRRLESASGLLATASGQCMAVRRAALSPFESVYGEDCVVPLDMALKGYLTVYAGEAIAYGSMPHTSQGELKARIRMTTRNLTGMVSRKALLNPLYFPGLAWALISHKLLRWFTPIFLVWWLAASVTLVPRGGVFLGALLGQTALYLLAGAGWFVDLSGRRAWPFLSQAYSFVLANIGFSLGLVGAVRRHRITVYK